ncbi:hypothetical protein ID866_12257 [Astraeus odoratus]|nr:hypothetical protein ID866_12257 [Astraeus odoratus]
MTACNDTLLQAHCIIWHTKWSLFIYNRVQAHQSCEGTLAVIKLVEALGQILVTNQHLDKLSAFHAYHLHGTLLHGPVLPASTSISRLGTRMVEEGEVQAVDGVHSTYVVWLT